MPNSGYRGMINSSFLGHRQRRPMISPNLGASSPAVTPDHHRSLSSLSHSWELLLSRRQYMQSMEEKQKKSRKVSFPPIPMSSSSLSSTPRPVSKQAWVTIGKMDSSRLNSITPFSTLGKPTCGFLFNLETDNRKLRTGIPASDLVKWRYFNEVSY